MKSASLDAIRKCVSDLPQTPGVYLIKDASGTPVYIGKANSLKARVSCHFKSGAMDPKTMLIQRDAAKVDVIQTASEAEALLLEASLVKEHSPKHNRELKDDKSYPFLKITMEEEFPRLLVVRGRPSDGSVYFGPFTSVYLLRQAVSLLRRLFPMRTCNPMPEKVCLMYHIGQCRGPCVKEIGRDDYGRMVKELVLFLQGKKAALLRILQSRMVESSKAKRYEEAQIFRDQIQALSTISVLRSPLNRVWVLEEMRDRFKLSAYPRRIEAFDVSNFTGKNPVASMVVFEDGAPKRSDYRKFKIRTVEWIDDYAAMREVVRRRYERLLAERQPLPDLILIDGGKTHLSAAKEVLDELNMNDRDIISIAKKHEHIFKPERQDPYILPQDSAVLQLIRHIRDEAHRFAITFYRKLHRKAVRWSALDDIPGVGKTRKAILMKTFGNVSKIREAGREKLSAVRGIDEKTAKNIEEYFKTG